LDKFKGSKQSINNQKKILSFMSQVIRKQINIYNIILLIVLYLISFAAIGYSNAQDSAKTGQNAFPESEAGIAAYVNVGGGINLTKAAETFSQLEEIGENHAIGIISGCNNIHIYVDVDGNIVAYFLKDEPSSKIYAWGEKKLYPNIAIQTVCDKIGAVYEDIEPSIKYCHYQYPNADKIAIFSKNSDGYVHVSVPENYNLYEASWSLSGVGDYSNCRSNGNYCPALMVDGTQIEHPSDWNSQGMFNLDKVLSKGSHTLHPSHSNVAVVLLYKVG